MKYSALTRREFLRRNAAGASFLAAGGSQFSCRGSSRRDTGRKMIVLGLDGMDPRLTERMMQDGRLPTFRKLARDGFFGPLATTSPPQSPVAWASFISGCNPGGHGIFDFIHRDPANYQPYLSTSLVAPGSRQLRLGRHVLPLDSGVMENLRRGPAFWELLEAYDVPATIVRMPSNFPPSDTGQRTLAGLGTPDLLGTYGIFTLFTDDPFAMLDPDLGGGRIESVEFRRNAAHGAILGPPNGFLSDAPDTRAELLLYRAGNCPALLINAQGQEILLNEGEWSPWVELSFDMVPGVSVSGICRFFLKAARPFCKLYASALHVDPRNPVLPLSTPPSYAGQLAAAIGPYHTKGLPADTKALDQGVLDEADFLTQDQAFLEENLALLELELSRFDSGLLFFYLSHIDQRSHMFWRLSDPQHPAYDARLAAEFGATIETSYEQMDRVLETTLAAADEYTELIVMSDHGFHSYDRSCHLNRWLEEAGYLALSPRADRDQQLLRNVDWSKTRAYAFGFNGICVNQAGREGQGIVAPRDTPALVAEIATALESLRDPLSGRTVVRHADAATAIYHGPHLHLAPDLVVGYDAGFRCSWQTALGEVPPTQLASNRSKWSGDHLMAADISPGILLTRRPIHGAGMALQDVTALVLDRFGVPIPQVMDGRAPATS